MKLNPKSKILNQTKNPKTQNLKYKILEPNHYTLNLKTLNTKP